jgi:hypothetical protein
MQALIATAARAMSFLICSVADRHLGFFVIGMIVICCAIVTLDRYAQVLHVFSSI